MNYYIYTQKEKKAEASGEIKKTKMMVDAFNYWGLETDIIYYNIDSKFLKVLLRLPFYKVYKSKFRESINKIITNDTDFVYIRRYVIDYSFIRLIKCIKENHPTVKLLFEIPTYPYDGELSRLVDYPLLLKERYYRKRIKKYIDKIVTISSDKSIFGLNTISISNGIDITNIPTKNKYIKKNKTIDLIAVALFQKTHGFERSIKGLFEYYNNKTYDYDINIHFVGEGSELQHYKKLTKQYGLEKHIYFHGSLYGDKLDEIFDLSDIALSIMGFYKIDLKTGYPLKTREYCARGIPFVYAYNDPAIDDTFKYALRIENDSSSVNMNRIIEFYEDIYKENSQNIVKNMNQYAAKKMSMINAVKPIVDYIENI